MSETKWWTSDESKPHLSCYWNSMESFLEEWKRLS